MGSQAVEGPVDMMHNSNKPVAHIPTGSTIIKTSDQRKHQIKKNISKKKKQFQFDLNLHNYIETRGAFRQKMIKKHFVLLSEVEESLSKSPLLL